MVNSEEKILNKKNFWIIVINSTVFFLLAYLFFYLITKFATIIAASMFDIETMLYYHKISFYIGKSQWGFDSVKFIFSAGSIIALLFGTIFIIIYNKVCETDGLLKLFFLWGFFIGYSNFFGSILMGAMISREFGHVLNWTYTMDTARMLLIIFSLSVFIIIGILSTKPILFSANSYFNFLDKQRKEFFIRSQIIVPYFLGIAIIFLVRIPNNHTNNYFEILRLLSIIVTIVPVIFRCHYYPNFYLDEKPKSINIGRGYLIFLIIFLFLFRFGLSFGLRF